MVEFVFGSGFFRSQIASRELREPGCMIQAEQTVGNQPATRAIAFEKLHSLIVTANGGRSITGKGVFALQIWPVSRQAGDIRINQFAQFWE